MRANHHINSYKRLVLVGISLLSLGSIQPHAQAQIFKVPSSSNGHVSNFNPKDPLSFLPVPRGYKAIVVTVNSTVSASASASLVDMRRLSGQMNSIALDFNNHQSKLVFDQIPRSTQTHRVATYNVEPPNRYSVIQESKIGIVLPQAQAQSLASKLRRVNNLQTRVNGFSVVTSSQVSVQ